MKGIFCMRNNVQPSRLGAVIAAKRKKLGLSQRQLAASIGLNNATICKLEKDPTLVPDARTLVLLSEALALDYNYLLALNEVIPDDKDLRIIARAQKKMSDEEWQRLMDMLRANFPDAFAQAGGDGIDDIELELM